MTKEEIIELAIQAGFRVGPSRDGPDDVWGVVANLDRLAKLIAEKSKQEQGESNNSKYERSFIDGMQKQMQSSVDKAVRNMQNKLTQEWEVLQSIKRHTITTQDEIQTAILRVCKVANHDADFNVVGFHSFCNKLIELGAEKERENCAKLCEKLVLEDDSFYGEFSGGKDCAKAIRARGQE